MNNLIRKSATPFGALVVAVLFLVSLAIVFMSGVTHAVSSSEPQNDHLITIHDRGLEKIILTKANSIGDALKEAGIAVDANDAVEPAVSEKLVASNYQVNIYRARPVIIVDGNVRQKIMTPYQTAEQIIKSAGIILYPEDKTTIDRVVNLSDGAGLQLTITRSKPFLFTLYGKTMTARTLGKTLKEMLVEKDIKLSESDRISLDLDTQITENMAVKIWREGKQIITVDEVVNFDIETIEKADQLVGNKNILSVGTAGVRSVTYEISIEDGQEVGRIEIASIITKPAVKQVEAIGIKGKYNTPSENENVTWNFLLSQGFSKVQTAGIMGNLMQEHRFNTSDTPGGLGIVQWTGGRRMNLINQYPDSYTNIYSQLNYLMFELNGSYASVRNKILASESLTNVVQIFQNDFERCGICRESNRISYAQTILGSHDL